MDKRDVKWVVDNMVDQDVRFVRLAFCDIFGQLKNVSISVSALESALTRGIGFNVSAIRGLMYVEDSDLLLFPDPDTMTILPWRPAEGKVARFFCDIRHSDGRPFEGDVRYLLKAYEKQLKAKKIGIQISSECEFYLFRQDADGNPTDVPMDRASYFDMAPLDKGENIRREICINMEKMGLSYETSHHEKGPVQNEIRFNQASLLDAADHLVTFRDIVKVTANGMGLFASFLPKPLFNESGSGLAINIAVEKEGDKAALTRAMVAGILRRIEEITIFLNPIANSYERLGLFDAPAKINWGYGNQKVLIKANEAEARIKVRSADPSCNPYLAYLLLAGAAMEGIEDNLDPDDYNKGTELPDTMNDAIKLAQKSDFTTTMIPKALFDRFLQSKREDWEESSLSGDPMLKAKNMEFPVT